MKTAVEWFVKQLPMGVKNRKKKEKESMLLELEEKNK